MQRTPSPGHLAIVGLGPGQRDLMAPRAIQMLQACDTVIGYRVYIEQIRDLLAGKDVHVSELTHEVERATLAVQRARDGHRVCIVSSGDAGIYGMAGLVLDLLSAEQEEEMEASSIVDRQSSFDGSEKGQETALKPIPTYQMKVDRAIGTNLTGTVRVGPTGEASTPLLHGMSIGTAPCSSGVLASPSVPCTPGSPKFAPTEASPPPIVEVVPGISALNAAAALLGAPLMHDFAVISLSDLLTPWATIAQRLSAAAAADFVIVLYNPSSRKRHWQLGEARRLLLASRSTTTPVGLVRNAYRPGQQVWLTTLEQLLDYEVDMFTTVVVGNSCTRIKQGRMITPRGYERYNAF